MRPFQSWSVDSLESELDRTSKWLRARLVTFGNTWDLPPIHPDRLPDFRELRTIIRVLGRETRRLEVMADELRLRRHWSAEGRARALVEENWRVYRAGDNARVRRVK
jgi:hypothetical protein